MDTVLVYIHICVCVCIYTHVHKSLYAYKQSLRQSFWTLDTVTSPSRTVLLIFMFSFLPPCVVFHCFCISGHWKCQVFLDMPLVLMMGKKKGKQICDWDSNCMPVTIATEQEPSGTREPERKSEMRSTVPKKAVQRRERSCVVRICKKKMFCFLSRASVVVALVIESSCLVSVFKTLTFESHLWGSVPNCSKGKNTFRLELLGFSLTQPFNDLIQRWKSPSNATAPPLFAHHVLGVVRVNCDVQCEWMKVLCVVFAGSRSFWLAVKNSLCAFLFSRACWLVL